MSYNERQQIRRGSPSRREIAKAQDVLSTIKARSYYNMLIANRVDQTSAALQTAKLFELPATNFALQKKMETIRGMGLVKDKPKKT